MSLAGARLRGLLVLVLVLGTVSTSVATAAPPPPRVVVGSGGWLFVSQDWRVACQDRGSSVRVATAVRDLALALRRSGRRVVLTVGPDKSTPYRSRVPARGVPDRVCGDASRDAVWRELRRLGGADFLDLRPALAEAASGPLPAYWKKDTHWTPTGGAVFAERLASRLAPGVRRRVQRREGTCSRDGDLARDLGRPDGETVRCAVLTNPGVTVVEHGYWSIGTSQPARWSSTVRTPGAAVLPGRTVLVADSFAGTAYDSLAPLFEEAVFFHPGYRQDDLAPVLRQLERADTVVIEVVERFVQRWRLFSPDAVAAVRGLRHRRDVVTVPLLPPGVPFPCTCAPPPVAAR